MARVAARGLSATVDRHAVGIAQQIERRASGKHGPGGEEQQISAFVGVRVLMPGGQRRDAMQEQYRAVGATPCEPGNKGQKKYQLHGPDHDEGGLTKVGDGVEMAEYAGAVFGSDEFVQRPHQHHE